MAASRQLVHSWLQIATDRGSLSPQPAVDALNKALGTKYDLARVGQWRRGERSMPEPVIRYLIRYVVAEAITAEGGKPPASSSALDRLVERLQPPPRE